MKEFSSNVGTHNQALLMLLYKSRYMADDKEKMISKAFREDIDFYCEALGNNFSKNDVTFALVKMSTMDEIVVEYEVECPHCKTPNYFEETDFVRKETGRRLVTGKCPCRFCHESFIEKDLEFSKIVFSVKSIWENASALYLRELGVSSSDISRKGFEEQSKQENALQRAWRWFSQIWRKKDVE